VPRQGCPILVGARPIGEVTSGTFSPTFAKPIAMGYVRPEFAQPGTESQIDIRGRSEPAHVVPLPFYCRNHKGASR
jgi:aminomethyltransferase